MSLLKVQPEFTRALAPRSPGGCFTRNRSNVVHSAQLGDGLEFPEEKICSARNNSTAHVRPSGCQPSRLVRSDGKVQCLGSLSWARPTSQRVFSFKGFAATKCCTSRVSRCSTATWDLWSSRGLMPRRRRFSGSRPTDQRALYRMVRQLHLAGERSTGPTPRQHQLGLADSRILPIASFSRLSSASVGVPCLRGVTSSVCWVLLPFHTVPPAC